MTTRPRSLCLFLAPLVLAAACAKFDTKLHGDGSPDVDAPPSSPSSDASSDAPDASVADPDAAIDQGLVEGPVPYFFGGTNSHRIYTQHDLSPSGSVEIDAAAQIAAARAAGFRMLRIFLHQEEMVPWEVPSVTYTFEGPALGQWHDDKLEWIDRLMPELIGDPADPFDDVRLVVTFFNALKGTPSGDVQEDLYLETFGELGFYQDELARDAFKARIRHVMEHRNPYLGDTEWRDLGIIAGWEPMNEPGLHTRDDAARTTPAMLADWIGEMAVYIKSLDGDGTLVLSGTSGQSGYAGVDVGDNLVELVAAAGPEGIPGVDVYTLHYYGDDPTVVLDDSLAALPAGKRLWVTEFGDTRVSSISLDTYDPSSGGVLGKLSQRRIPWMFWHMGIRTDDNDWSRFTWDDDWDSLAGLAGNYTRPIATFDESFQGSFTRNDMTAATVERVMDGHGFCVAWEMPGNYTEVVFAADASHDVAAKAVTVRLKASRAMVAEIQFRDAMGGYTRYPAGANPFVELTTEWRYYQVPIDSLSFTEGNFSSDQLKQMVLWMKEGSAAGETVYIDDVWIW